MSNETKKYTTAQRNQAAEALAMMASCTDGEIFDKDGNVYDEASLVDMFDGNTEDPAFCLADDAYMAIPATVDIKDDDGYTVDVDDVPRCEQYAEAEAWVRSGWSNFGDEQAFVK